MAKNLLEDIFYIKSQYLKLIEPFMVKYFDYDSSMLLDQIKRIVEAKCPNHITYENGIPTADYLKTFYENEWLTFIDSDYSHRNGLEKEPTYTDIADIFPQYFDFDIEDEEVLLENYKVYLSLDCMAYIYFLQKSGSFNHSFIVEALGLEYQSALHNEIYPEMLSLYRMILESKKYKNKGGKITLTNNFHQIDINSHAWFLDDMEKYFKDRFPDLTLEKINELLPKPNKAGRKAKDILTDEQYKAIADRYMEDMDYGNQPYVVFKHTDIDRAHLHVLSIRVDESGKNLDSNFENMR